MALSVSGFPEPVRPTDPNADPSASSTSASSTAQPQSQDTHKNINLVHGPRFRSLFSGANGSRKPDPAIPDPLSHTVPAPFDLPTDPTSSLNTLTPTPSGIVAANNITPPFLPPVSSQTPKRMAYTPPPSYHIPASVSSSPADPEFDRHPHHQLLPTASAIRRKRSFPFTQAVLSPLPHHLPHSATSPVRIPVGTTRRDAASLPKHHTTSQSRMISTQGDSLQPSQPLAPPTSHQPPNPNPHISTSIPPPNSTGLIISAVPTVPTPAPSGTQLPSISPARPTITINTSVLWNPPSSSPSQHMQQQPSSQRPPASRILLTATRAGNVNPQSTINLRYQSLAIVDPSGSDRVHSSRMNKSDLASASSSTRYMPPPTRIRRPKTSPGPSSNMLEAIPNSWASASRPSDLRPTYPSKSQQQQPLSAVPGVRTTVNRSPPPIQSRALRARSRSGTRRDHSIDRGIQTSAYLASPRPRQLSITQPTPKRLSLGMVMNTTKLVSASPPPSSVLGPSMSKPTLTAATMTATRVLPIRSLTGPPSSSSSHTLPFTRTPVTTPKPTSTSFSISPRSIPPSPFLLAPPNSSINAITSALPSGFTTSPASALTDSPPSPTSLSSCSDSAEFRHGLGKTGPDGEAPSCDETHKKIHYPHSTDIDHPHREAEFDYYGGEEQAQYDDKLLRMPISPTLTSSSGEPVVEVFVDNLYYDEFERSPSPIVYARHGGAESDDEEGYFGVNEGWGRVSPRGRRQVTTSTRTTSYSQRLTGSSMQRTKRGNKKQNPSSPISYHSDDSSLFYGSHRPRRRRRSQLRSYRFLYRPPGSLSGGGGDASGGGAGGVGVSDLERQRSPSPICYARRRSLDFLYDDDDDDEEDGDDDGDSRGGGGSTRVRWGGARGNVAGFSWERGGLKSGKSVRRQAQPRSFLYDYSTPPDARMEESGDESVKEKDKERGRKRDRALISMPLGKEKEREKEKEKRRPRKGSRGLLDELAAVATLNVGGGKRAGTRSRSRSLKRKNKEKEGQWKKWKRDKEKERDRDGPTESSSSGEGLFVYQEVLDIGIKPGDEAANWHIPRRNSLAGLEFAP